MDHSRNYRCSASCCCAACSFPDRGAALVSARQPIKQPMSERDLITRLFNWGACQRGKPGGSMVARETRRSSYGGQGYKCMTDVICTMLRDAAHGPRGGSYTSSKLDFDDSRTIQAAWAKLTLRSQTLLKHHYVLERTWYVICRELDIKHWPARHFDKALEGARDEMESFLKR